jgi:flagellar biosynthesis protein FlhF
MNVLRFIGKNTREALSKVRQSLGDDAIIVSNRTVNGGNEVMAYLEESTVSSPMNDTKPVDVLDSIKLDSTKEDQPISFLSHINNKNRELDAEIERALNEEMMAALSQDVLNEQDEAMANDTPITVAEEVKTESVSKTDSHNHEMVDMLNEMREMRSILESQLSSLSWSNHLQRDPVKSSVMCTLLAAGFSTALCRQLTEKTPAALTEENVPIWIKAILSQKLNIAEDESEVLDKGGIFALVGPTGVGKTTTTAKLAARYVMKHGTENLGLITTDAYRIGGYEQLRIYGKILGVMVYAVKDEADLKIALNELKHKHTILIDTVGVSQRSEMVAEQMSLLSEAGKPIKKLLCLNATSAGETLNDVVRAYIGTDEKGLDGCIITKLDEALIIGSALDVIIQHHLKLYYTSNGQRVPEDIHIANKQYLIANALALASSKSRAFQMDEEDLAYVLANNANEAKYHALSQIVKEKGYA